MTDLDVSGERMIEDAYMHSLESYVIYVMHTASYAFAKQYCAGNIVLDLGCGSGYGAARIGEEAKRVEGVDVDAEAVAFAQRRYSRENVSFSQIKAGESLPFSDASFDVVLSFQVIEHVWDDGNYLKEAHRVLRPGGVMVVVTPDRALRLLPGQRPWNRWHVREYSGAQLERKVSQFFDVAASLKMGAAWDIAGVEIRRYRRTKWLTLPFTLPLVPDVLRRRGLDLLHALRTHPGKVDAKMKIPVADFGFDDKAMLIEEDPPNPLNLVIVGRKGRDATT